MASQAPEFVIRQGLVTYLQKKKLTLNKRTVNIKPVADIQEIGTTDLPCVGIGKVIIPNKSFVTHETVSYTGKMSLFISVAKGSSLELNNDDILTAVAHTIFMTLASTHGLTLEGYGVFSHSFTFKEIQEYESFDATSIAKEYELEFAGSFTVPSQD